MEFSRPDSRAMQEIYELDVTTTNIFVNKAAEILYYEELRFKKVSRAAR